MAMKCNGKYLILFMVVAISSCINQKKESERQPLFPQGNKNTSKNFVGEVWLKSLVDADTLNGNTVGSVTFSPGARTNWHSHPAGQIILATEGVGYYQEKGKKKIILHKGDIVKCPPNLPHWHGASPESKFVQIAISSRHHGPAVWLDSVTDSTYISN